jgi:hypothetical protein
VTVPAVGQVLDSKEFLVEEGARPERGRRVRNQPGQPLEMSPDGVRLTQQITVDSVADTRWVQATDSSVEVAETGPPGFDPDSTSPGSTAGGDGDRPTCVDRLGEVGLEGLEVGCPVAANRRLRGVIQRYAGRHGRVEGTGAERADQALLQARSA